MTSNFYRKLVVFYWICTLSFTLYTVIDNELQNHTRFWGRSK